MITPKIQSAAVALSAAVQAHGSDSDQAADAESALLKVIFDSGVRPDWVNCVRKTPSKSVCGKNISMDWAFVDWDHADRNEQNQGRLVTCPTCKAVRSALREVLG